jgi:multidrug efflux pump subunit AcrB
MLSLIGETLNIMTLGGLALAVGILVDEATVTIENINWHLEQGKAVELAIMDGARQIVTPAFVSLLCICIVFVPMFFLQGVARFLFVPMAEAVIFAMIWSFILSRTLVPTMAKYPHRLDPNRRIEDHRFPRSLMSFGDGPHRCPGAAVALLESVIFLDHLFRVPGIRLAQTPTITSNPMVESYELRGAIVECN